jgi:hypothetical protein
MDWVVVVGWVVVVEEEGLLVFVVEVIVEFAGTVS